MIRVAHIINPVKVTEKSDLFYAQPVTFESMRKAKLFSTWNDQIGLYTTQYEEDKEIIPPDFIQLSNLSRSILDLNRSLKGKKLPLIADILEKIDHEVEAEYVIYTNMDIALMPGFYDYVFQKIYEKHDVIIINRRRIESRFQSIDQLPEMYAELGRSHPGFDCFVFKKSYIKQLILNQICIGISFLEVSLIHNLMTIAEKPLFVPDAHLTFHLGMDVLVERNNAFYHHNRKVYFQEIQPYLKANFVLEKFPYGTLPLPKRALNWMLNPSLFTRNYLHLQGKSWRRKIKLRLDEWRWRILQR